MSNFNRRQFLMGSGGYMLALPFLPSILGASKAHAAGVPPKRFIAIMNHFGQIPSLYFPQTTTSQVANNIWQRKLSEISGPMSSVINSKFDGYRNKLNIVSGLDIVSGCEHHNTSGFLGGNVNEEKSGSIVTNPTIDVLMEGSSAVFPNGAGKKVLRVAGLPDFEGWCGFSWRPSAPRPDGKFGNFALVPNITKDTAAFDYVFAGNPGAPGADLTTQRNILAADRVMESHRALAANRRLSGADRNRLAEFVERVHETQKGMITPVTSGACKPIAQSPFADNQPSSKKYQNFINTIVSGMACDSVRIATIHIHHYSDTYPQFTGGLSPHHQSSHGNSNSPDVQRASLQYNTWISALVADLIGKMDQVIEADGSTLLDNSLVMWGNEDGLGHDTWNLPILMAGSLQGKFKTGNFVDYRSREFFPSRGFGRPYVQLLISIMRAMGMQPSEYITKGENGGFGGWKKSYIFEDPNVPRTDIYNKYWRQFEGERNATLPYLFNG